MATGSKRNRITLEVNFASEQQKGAFQEKLDAAKRLLFSGGPPQRDNYSFLSLMLDRVLGTAVGSPTDMPVRAHCTNAAGPALEKSLLDTSGTSQS